MNKLLVGNVLEANNLESDLNLSNESLLIKVEGNNKLYIINQIYKDLTIDLLDNSELEIYLFSKDNVDNNIIINQNNNTSILFNYNYINNKDNLLNIKNNINGNYNESTINVKNISNNGNSEIDVIANIISNTKDNNVIESIDGITNGGTVSVLPDIICESNEVVANHFTTIGNVDKEELNYLMSKGLRENTSKVLILNGFINSNMDNYIKEQISL